MSRMQDIFAAHPHAAGSNGAVALQCVESCMECSNVCSTCADACLSEAAVADMVRCIRLNLDCADICDTTGRLIARAGKRDADTLRAQLQACASACRACERSCREHASHMDHCRICAEACAECANACDAMAAAIV
jgi:uncharacterized membrane protein